ncbi:urease accessory protein UreD [Nocardioides cavernaquae]|uniref:Urease accessory protein UreD n=1 Tax=Nocardioides cavernaquae TaxID=2321396 RepID=A0A3A5HHP8_9ACTN|nr:urease accessory protein UreD [Nocardioides cavernaquae]RJS47217.1 urease accessory protein UreD [Nocardioides cavernaquae]
MSTLTDVAPTTASRTTIHVERSGGRVRVRTAASGPSDRPLIRPMLLGADDRIARISLVPEGALLLAGDAVEVDVHVGTGAVLELHEAAGTVAYDMRGDHARWDVTVRLDEGATLLWGGEPFVVSAGADVRRTTRIVLDAGAGVALRETLVLGRHGEAAGRLHQTQTVEHASGVPLLVEELDVDAVRMTALLGGHRVIGSLLLLGDACAALPASSSADRFDLESGGTLLRRLAHEAHAAHDAAAWDQVVREICC